MNNEPITCRKCAHQQFSGTHCDFCGNLLIERRAPDKKLSKFAVVRILGFASILVICFVAGLIFHRSNTPPPAEPPPVTVFPSQQAGVLNKVMQTAAQSNTSAPTAAEIFARVAPGIVTLYQDDAAGKHQRVIGAGFLLDGTTIATNNHVVQGASAMSARFSDGTERKVNRVLGVNRQHDVALLQIDKVQPNADKAAIASLEAAGREVGAAALTSSESNPGKSAASGLRTGRSASVSIGDAVIAAGSPTGLSGSVSQGIVTAMPNGLLKTNLPVNPAWSGGPLLNMQGEVVGMITSQPPDAAAGNFALPVEWATGMQTNLDSNASGPGSAGVAQASSHNFGPYKFSLAALEKRSLPFTTPADLESAQFSARLTAPAGAHLHITISRQGHVMYDSGDVAGAHFTLSLKRGDYVMLIENSSKSATGGVAISGSFSSDL